MKIAQTPPELMPRATPGSLSRTRGRNCEEKFLDCAIARCNEIETDRVYIPVQWWQCMIEQMNRNPGKKTFLPVPEVQAFLDTLDQTAKYFTVCRSDEGVHERLPPDTIVISACTTGDIPIPLLPPE